LTIERSKVRSLQVAKDPKTNDLGGALPMIPVGWLRRFHAMATIIWLLLAIPSVVWWRDSVVWVVAMSWYAVVVSHATAWQAARAEDAAD
jgi:hypothetical protein